MNAVDDFKYYTDKQNVAHIAQDTYLMSNVMLLQEIKMVHNQVHKKEEVLVSRI